jgi:hypothetical protein
VEHDNNLYLISSTEVLDDIWLKHCYRTTEVTIMTKAQAAALREKWAYGDNPPCRHLHLELEHNNNDYLTDNYHCTACGELVAANTRDPFQVI